MDCLSNRFVIRTVNQTRVVQSNNTKTYTQSIFSHKRGILFIIIKMYYISLTSKFLSLILLSLLKNKVHKDHRSSAL